MIIGVGKGDFTNVFFFCLKYVLHMMRYRSDGKESFQGKRVAISGSGNVAQYAALKVIELGGVVLSLSDSRGAIVTEREEGISREVIALVKELRLVCLPEIPYQIQQNTLISL